MLNFDLLVDHAALSRQRTLRSSSLKPRPLEGLGVVSLLKKRVESGLCLIKEEDVAGGVAVGVASGAEKMAELWCALVCLQYTR